MEASTWTKEAGWSPPVGWTGGAVLGAGLKHGGASSLGQADRERQVSRGSDGEVKSPK